ncbi:DNA replication/repair protein RecF [Psychroserpens sp.]|uniref:DNA replication/repair protein RecF n=1 Tax=Psychroserpens sp. TaxID=2020870 RepID=UPI001B0DE7CD|nr:DNA replication/repair protein RecF [Psychroserpens sp.]MBO6606340.1 DNA replication/repair protein RecF [Psychroserpens sp.]MBO6653044.1 DNA replication/repair protein RecF [Psychroserpens sp.]MBO6680929.1 DNA replication/repair protein RecF [Psychroserpens sp.]MBO6750114.1 DNA replication/repair protein RecF [Psychroserpens sp.]MBO6914595.1 DNA replication/repair protein RecF [Psychroserpens sp.]
MILNTLSLVNYKNFESQDFEFDTKINCFVGANGVGKTNVLDAIYHLAFGKSYFNPVATQNIRHNQEFFVVDGVLTKNDKTEKVIVSLKRGQKKVIKRNAKAYEKFSDHIGFIPLVIISPADRDLIIEGSDVRRKFIDSVISQSDKGYLNNLINYNKVLSQRNALLKYFALNNTFNNAQLEVYNEQLHTYGAEIFKTRDAFLKTFIPIFKERYKAISNDNESVNITYKSDLYDGDLDELLRLNVNKDKALQYTSVGIHKDDLIFQIGDYPIKKFGSQGQQKSFLIALKLAQFDFIKDQSGVTPLLLLDDIFDKLDENRVAQIISLVDNENFGQLFISDTHADRTEAVVKQIHQSYKLFKL